MKSKTIFVSLLAVTLAGCAQYATVSEKRPHFQPVRSTVGAVGRAEQCIVDGVKCGRRQPLVALGDYLAAAEEAERDLVRNPKDEHARATYNYAVARIFTAIQDGHLDPWSHPLTVQSAHGTYVLSHQMDPRKVRNPALYEFTPSDQFDVKGTYVKERTVKEGVGAPLVAVGKDSWKDAKLDFVSSRIYYGVTAIADFQEKPAGNGPRQVVLKFEDPLASETARLDGRTYPLAADFTVPLAVMLARENPKKLEISRLLRPEKYAETAHIVRLQPYDPNKTVVIVTHGLMDSPATWTPMLNYLRGDPFIREHYQFWFYSYPSGYPYPYSAMIMREQLDAIEKRYPLHNKIVLIGHSMGSLISRLMITDSGNTLWLATFGKSPAETKLAPQARKTLEEALIFRHRPEVGRVIFISGPHRGATMATNLAGRIGSMLVRAPKKLLTLNNEVRALVVADSTTLRLRTAPNSIDTLAPNNRFVKAINTIPITPGIPYHSIVGDRGKGGNKDQTPPISTDGVVPYWSSHLDGAQSELIVPSNHSAHQNPKAFAEVRRILHLNAGAPVKKSSGAE